MTESESPRGSSWTHTQPEIIHKAEVEEMEQTLRDFRDPFVTGKEKLERLKIREGSTTKHSNKHIYKL